MKGREQDQQMIDIYVQVIDKNLNNLFNTIDLLKQEVNKKIMNEQNNKEIKRQAQLIRAILLIREKDPNSQDNKTRIPDQITKIIKERILILIHLNCPPNINCQQCVNVPQSSAILELKSSVFLYLSEVSRYDYKFKNILQNDHNIILHLTHILIQFASQSQLNKENKSFEQDIQQLQEQTSSLSFIISSLNHLLILFNDDNNVYQEIIKILNALHSLSILTRYQINTHINQQYDLQTFSIRNKSRYYLRSIQELGDAQVQSELVNVGYSRVMVITISTAGGSGEEQDLEIRNGLLDICWFLRELQVGRNDNNSSFQPLPLHAKRSIEQIEEEGANEEIDAQMNNKGYHGIIKFRANEVKAKILNCFIHNSNLDPY